MSPPEQIPANKRVLITMWKCGKVIDLFDEKAPKMTKQKVIEGNIVDEQQLYYKGICADCAKLNEEKKRKAK